MPGSAQLELSRTLVRILRYETHQRGLNPDVDGWVQLHELMNRCSIAQSRDEVISVAHASEGRLGKRFELDQPAKGFFRIRARYRHRQGGVGNVFNTGPRHRTDEGWRSRAVDYMPKPAQAKSSEWGEAHAGRERQSSPDRGPSTVTGGSSSKVMARSLSETACQGLALRFETTAATISCQDDQDSSLTGPQSFDISTPRCHQDRAWLRYVDPETGRAWFHNDETDGFFFEDAASDSGWCQYDSEHGLWWHNESMEAWFSVDF